MAYKSGWRVSLGLAGMGILGALLGSTVQHFYSLTQERSKAFEARQAEAYGAFLSAFDKSRMSQVARDEGRKEEAEQLKEEYELEVGAAVRRITVFGDKQVVEAIANWYRRDTLGPCTEVMNPEFAAWKAMREASLGRRQEVASTDLAAVAGRCILAVKQ